MISALICGSLAVVKGDADSGIDRDTIAKFLPQQQMAEPQKLRVSVRRGTSRGLKTNEKIYETTTTGTDVADDRDCCER